jgi:hypothetical protein
MRERERSKYSAISDVESKEDVDGWQALPFKRGSRLMTWSYNNSYTWNTAADQRRKPVTRWL